MRPIAPDETRLAAALGRIPVGLVVAEGAHRRILSGNDEAASLFGQPLTGLEIGALPLMQRDRTPYPQGANPLEIALTGEAVIGERALVIRDDDWLNVRVSAVPLTESPTGVTSAVLVVEDVSDEARSERDTHLLVAVGEALGEAGDLDTLLERVSAISVPSFADLCGVYLLREGELRLLAVSHRDPEILPQLREHFSRPVPLDGPALLSQVILTGLPVLMGPQLDEFTRAHVEGAQRIEWLREVLQPRAFLAVPMRTRREVIGVLTFAQTTASNRAFTAEDVNVASEIARRCAALIEQAEARADLARARDHAEALQRFAASMARASTIDAVVEETIRFGAPAAGADVVNVVLRLRGEPTVRIYHSTAGRPDNWPTVTVDRALPVVDTILSGESWFLKDREEFVRHFPALAGDLDRARMQAVATLPLVASDGDILGGIAFAFAHAQDFAGVQPRLGAVADLAAQSLDRARLFEHQRDVASALQVALLPSALPLLDDVPVEARYVAGGDVAVGGDWYDVLRLADGRIGLLIGDAAGRGVDAATMMGKVRNVAAALSMDLQSPAEVLDRINRYLHFISSRRSMITCCIVIVDAERRTLRYASAGHPPPLLLTDDGRTCFLEGARGVPLGVVVDARYTDATYVLERETTLLLYTDGLVERRGESIDEGLERLAAVLACRAGDEFTTLCDDLVGAMLGARADDDVALLAARVVPHRAGHNVEVELPADAIELRAVRHELGRWLTELEVESPVRDEVLVAVNEAVANSALHAYPSGEGRIRVALTHHDDTLHATVVDAGQWRSRPAGHDGRGLALINALMDDVRVDRTTAGTRVRMTRRLRPTTQNRSKN